MVYCVLYSYVQLNQEILPHADYPPSFASGML